MSSSETQISTTDVSVELQTSAKTLAIEAIKDVATQMWPLANTDLSKIQKDTAPINAWNTYPVRKTTKGGKSRSKNKASRVKSTK